MTDEGDRLSRFHSERHVLQNPVFILVSKPNVLKLDATARTLGFDGVLRRQHRNRLVQCFKDTMRRDDCRLEHVVLVRDIANRLKQSLRILNKRNEGAEGQHCIAGRVLHHAITAVPDDEGDADRANEIYEREEDGVIKDRVDVGSAILLVDLVELLQ